MALSAALCAVGAAVAMTAILHLNAAVPAYLAASDTDPGLIERRVAEMRTSLVLQVVASVAGLVVLPLLAVAARRGWRRTRPVAWTAAVLLVVVLAIALAGSPELTLAASAGDPPALRQAADNLIVGWYPMVTSFLVPLQIVLAAAFSLSLLRTSASDFFNWAGEGAPSGLWNYARPDTTR